MKLTEAIDTLTDYMSMDQIKSLANQARTTGDFLSFLVNEDTGTCQIARLGLKDVKDLEPKIRTEVRTMMRPGTVVLVVHRKRGEELEGAVAKYEWSNSFFAPRGGTA